MPQADVHVRAEYRPRLEGKVAVVTGAGSGIGKAVATRLASDGAKLLLVDLDEQSANRLTDELRESGATASAVAGNITDQAALDAALDTSRSELGSIPQVVVCNAGAQTFTRIWDLTEEEWRLVMDTNVYGTFLTLRTFSSAMREESKPGSIVTISSLRARAGSPFFAHYGASKAAVLNLTWSFALELARDGIRVNSIAPGAVRTPLWARAATEMGTLLGREPEGMIADRENEIPLGRFAEPEDIANAVAYLASEDSSYVTGECLHVCGGDLMI